MAAGIMGGLVFFSILFNAVGMLLSAGLWAVGSFSNNYTQSVNGRKGFLICGGAALIIGASQTLVSYLRGDWIPLAFIVGVLSALSLLVWLLRSFGRRRTYVGPGPIAEPEGAGRLSFAHKPPVARWVNVVLAAGATALAALAGIVAAFLAAVRNIRLGVRRAAARIPMIRRRLLSSIAWTGLRAASVLLPVRSREGWLQETWAICLDTPGLRRYQYAADALIKLPLLAWTCWRIADRSPQSGRRISAPDTSEKGRKRHSRPSSRKVLLAGRGVAVRSWQGTAIGLRWTARQACRPMDWVAATYARCCGLIVTLEVIAASWVCTVGGPARVWEDLEQLGVLIVLVSGALCGWRKLRGIKMQDDGAEPIE